MSNKEKGGDYSSSERVYLNFHKNVKTFLTEQGKSMVDLANYLNLTRQGLYNHLKSHSPNYFLVNVISEYLNIPIEVLLGGSPSKLERPSNRRPYCKYLKSRIYLYLERKNISLQEFIDRLRTKAKKEEILQFIDTIESSGEFYNVFMEHNLISTFSEKKLYPEDNNTVMFLERIAEALNSDYESFFFIKDTTTPSVEPSINRAVLEDLLDQEYSLEDWSMIFRDVLEERRVVIERIIEYFTKKYPNDPISIQLTEIGEVDRISLQNKKYRKLSELINANLSK